MGGRLVSRWPRWLALAAALTVLTAAPALGPVDRRSGRAKSVSVPVPMCPAISSNCYMQALFTNQVPAGHAGPLRAVPRLHLRRALLLRRRLSLPDAKHLRRELHDPVLGDQPHGQQAAAGHRADARRRHPGGWPQHNAERPPSAPARDPAGLRSERCGLLPVDVQGHHLLLGRGARRPRPGPTNNIPAADFPGWDAVRQGLVAAQYLEIFRGRRRGILYARRQVGGAPWPSPGTG